jgi:H+-translocating NAD(P) transhydrogenase subunit alpha
MKLLVTKETKPGEKRVAVVPEVVSKLNKLGFEVSIQSGAGEQSLKSDEDYKTAGATIVTDLDAALSQAEVVASVNPLTVELISKLNQGALLVSFAQAKRDIENLKSIIAKKVSILSFDFLPRISRAQAADALTSQATVAGYHTMLKAASLSQRMFPLVMTASGTIRPAKVLVLGAGVAGLQVMSIAKKLGAVVSGYDVRVASKDEVKSVGASFIELDLPPLEGTGGYARELNEERALLQQELLTPYITASDVLVTTAAVPGRPAPRLVTDEMLRTMRPGSVVADMAAESGGNVAGSQPGETINIAGITLWGGSNIPSQMSPDASFLYSGNIVSMLGFCVKEGKVELDLNDEVIKGSALVIAGEVVNEFVQKELNGGSN